MINLTSRTAAELMSFIRSLELKMAFVDDISESISATTGTTGSFQNQTNVVIDQPTCSIVCRRKRDMMAVLAEAKANQTSPFRQTTVPNVPAK